MIEQPRVFRVRCLLWWRLGRVRLQYLQFVLLVILSRRRFVTDPAGGNPQGRRIRVGETNNSTGSLQNRKNASCLFNGLYPVLSYMVAFCSSARTARFQHTIALIPRPRSWRDSHHPYTMALLSLVSASRALKLLETLYRNPRTLYHSKFRNQIGKILTVRTSQFSPLIIVSGHSCGKIHHQRWLIMLNPHSLYYSHLHCILNSQAAAATATATATAAATATTAATNPNATADAIRATNAHDH